MIESSASPQPGKSPFANPRQRAIFERLHLLLGESIAHYWRDACDIVNNSEYTTKGNIVFHLLREMDGLIRDVISPLIAKGEDHETKRVEEIGHLEFILKASEALGLSDKATISDWTSARSFHKLAHRSGLHSIRQFDETVWNSYERALDVVLVRIESNYTRFEATLQTLAQKENPVSADLSTLKAVIPHSQLSIARFFSELKHPNWIIPLLSNGYFKIDSIRSGENAEWFGPWPPSEYLVRMSSGAPEIVARVFSSLETNHPRVFIDMMRAALMMPPALAASMISSSYVLGNLSWMKYPEDEVAEGVVHLIEGKELTVAVQVMNVLFTLKKGESSSLHETESALGAQEWHYQAALKKCTDALEKIDPNAVRVFLLKLLQQALELQGRSAPDDASTFWLAAIEPNEQNQYSTSLESIIIIELRDCYESQLRNASLTLEVAVHELESKNWNVFKRVALHLLVEFGQFNMQIVRERLFSLENLDDHDLVHEYTRLLRAHFPSFSIEDRLKFLQLIETSPDVKHAENDEDKERRRRYWQRNKLSVIRDALPTNFSQFLDTLEKELGVADEYAEFTHYMRSWVGPESPLSLDDLRALKFEELIDYLKKFVGAAPREWAPTEEGLGRELKKLIAEQPKFYSSNAMAFSELSPTYVRAFFGGIRDGRKTDSEIDWSNLLSLCEWVIQQPRGEDKINQGILERDPHWGWSRQAIAELIQDGLLESENKLIPAHKPQVWGIIMQLIQDPDPIPERDIDSNDYLSLSINTVRGYAFECIMRYMERTIIVGESSASEHGPAIRLGYVPEAVTFLKEFVHSNASPMNRYQLGRWFTTLYRFSKALAEELKDGLFAEESSNVTLREAAWEGYSTHILPNEDLYEILEANYEWAVEHYGVSTDENGSLRSDPFANLGCHLAYLFLIGEIDGDDSLLEQFYSKSSDRVNEYVWEFVAKRSYGKGERSSLEKIKEFWDTRFSIISSESALHKKELGSIGWMALAEELQPEWLLSRLYQVLKLSVTIEPDHFVAKKLAELSATFPKECFDCFEIMIFQGQFVLWQEDAAKTLLRASLNSGNVVLSERAKELINRLLARGLDRYRDLL